MVVFGPIFYIFFFWLGCIRAVEPVHQYFFLFAWVPYLWTVDRFLRWKYGRSFVSGSLELLGLLAFSVVFWCLFEAFNLRLHNWSYQGFPEVLWVRWLYNVVTFSTVVPGILWTAWLLESKESTPFKQTPRTPSRFCIVMGIGMFILAMGWPERFFPLVWGCLFFLMEPIVQRLGGHSLIQDWKQGRWHKTASLFLGGIICALFWEFNNYWAGAKWVYHLPYWNFGRIFEMPILGYIGYLPFALEVFVTYETIRLLWRRATEAQKIAITCLATAFCLWTFWGMDRFLMLA